MKGEFYFLSLHPLFCLHPQLKKINKQKKMIHVSFNLVFMLFVIIKKWSSSTISRGDKTPAHLLPSLGEAFLKAEAQISKLSCPVKGLGWQLEQHPVLQVMFDTAVPAMLKTHKRNIFTCEIMRFSFKSVQLNKTQKDVQLFYLIIIDSRIFFSTSTFYFIFF